jgi:hypothetical protein
LLRQQLPLRKPQELLGLTCQIITTMSHYPSDSALHEQFSAVQVTLEAGSGPDGRNWIVRVGCYDVSGAVQFRHVAQRI